MAYEDLTTFTEVDPSNHWSQTATRNTGNPIIDVENSYVYKDYGVDYFGDYKHHVDACLTTSGAFLMGRPNIGVWGVTDNPGAYEDLTEGQIVAFYRINGGTKLYLEDIGNSNNDSYVIGVGTVYYLIIERSGSTCTCKIYSDSDRTALLDTLSITCQTTLLQYLMAGFAPHGTSGSSSVTGYSENFDLSPPSVITVPLVSSLAGRLVLLAAIIPSGTAAHVKACVSTSSPDRIPSAFRIAYNPTLPRKYL